MDFEAYKAILKGLLRTAYQQKSKEFRRKLADHLRNLADDLDAQYVEPQGPDPDAT